MIDMKTDDFAHRGIDSPDGDSAWRAFRYVMGEMSPAEAEAFEETLASDQEARELVARSTGLVIDLFTAGSLSAAQNGSRHGSSAHEPAEHPLADVRPAAAAMPARRRKVGRWAVAGLAAAVCCCVAVGVTLFSHRVATHLADFPSGDSSDGGASHLVAIWSERLAELAPEQATTEPAATESTTSERTESSPSGESDDSRLATATENAPAGSAAALDQIASDDSDVPSWMIAAVELGQRPGPAQLHKPDGSSSEIREN
jgi:anti-sigma-K factor RskA